MALTEIMKMKEEDLVYLVEKHNGALGSTGTGGHGSEIHCCFSESSVVQVQRAEPDESSSGFKLVAEGCEYAIGIEQ